MKQCSPPQITAVLSLLTIAVLGHRIAAKQEDIFREMRLPNKGRTVGYSFENKNSVVEQVGKEAWDSKQEEDIFWEMRLLKKGRRVGYWFENNNSVVEQFGKEAWDAKQEIEKIV